MVGRRTARDIVILLHSNDLAIVFIPRPNFGSIFFRYPSPCPYHYPCHYPRLLTMFLEPILVLHSDIVPIIVLDIVLVIVLVFIPVPLPNFGITF